VLFKFADHRGGIFDLRKCGPQRGQHDRLDLIGRCLRRVERRRPVADEGIFASLLSGSRSMLEICISFPHRQSGNLVQPGTNERSNADMEPPFREKISKALKKQLKKLVSKKACPRRTGNRYNAYDCHRPNAMK
jgi:hypothetical protein